MIACVPCGRTFDRIEALELHCTTEVHRLIAGDDHFESLLRASKKAQAEILARVRAEPSCEELEARRAIAGGGS